MTLLETKGLTKNFFGLVALDKVDIQVRRGEMVGLIGPNGSGKTTLFNCITGLIPPTSGKVFFKGEDITGLKTHEIALKGISRTFQLIRIFPKLTVMENMVLAIQQFQGERILGSILHTPHVRRMEKEARDKAIELLELFGIDHLKDEYAGNLSYGQRKLLEVGMGLMPDPEILLLDEPTSAVNPTMIKYMKSRIRELNEAGQTFFIVEHNMDVVMDLCERIIVLDHGQKIAEGPPEKIRSDKKVIDAYFGA
jgi:ABC-type branched-subunit amino acid transport system ATPase component